MARAQRTQSPPSSLTGHPSAATCRPAPAAPSAGGDGGWIDYEPDRTRPKAILRATPAWAFEPITGWMYLLFVIVCALTPLLPVNWVLSIVMAIYVYRERKFRGLPAFWWPVGVLTFGPLAYIVFVYRRHHHRTLVPGWV